MDQQLDILCRLQTLEGVFGVPDGTFTRRSMSRVRAMISDIGGEMHPEWLSSGDTGFYRQTWKRADSFVHCEQDTDEIMQNALAGVSSVSSDITKAFVRAGTSGANGILSGKGTRWVLRHFMGPYMKQRARDLHRRTGREEPLDSDYDEICETDIHDADWFFIKENIPRMWAALDAHHKSHDAFRSWLAAFELTGEFSRPTDIANGLGVSPQTVAKQFRESLQYLAPIILPEFAGDMYGLRERHSGR